MTVHKSKGLEFPVVFFCGCGEEFNRSELRKSLIYDPDSGIGMQIADKTGFTRVDTPIRTAVSRSVTTRASAEEMRILYVALTRASEVLYVTATIPENKLSKLQSDPFIKKYTCRYTALSADCFLDWLIPVVAQEHPCFKLSVLNAEDVPDACKRNSDADRAEPSRENIESLKKLFCEKFEQRYIHEATVSIPAKLSVSKLKPDLLESDGAATLADGTGGKEQNTVLPSLAAAPHTPREKGISVQAGLPQKGPRVRISPSAR
jgi:ATP-dependent helicase/nuclease subunit A